MISGIYVIFNLTNGMLYIGSAVDVISRFRGHVNDLKRNDHHSSRLQNAWNKYGKNSFIFELIEIVENPTKKKLEAREQYWMDFYDSSNRNNGYNICPKAGSPLGIKWPTVARENKKIYWRSKKSQQHRNKIIKRNKTKKQRLICSKATKIRMATNKAKQQSGKILRRWNLSVKGRKIIKKRICFWWQQHKGKVKRSKKTRLLMSKAKKLFWASRKGKKAKLLLIKRNKGLL